MLVRSSQVDQCRATRTSRTCGGDGYYEGAERKEEDEVAHGALRQLAAAMVN